MKESKYNKENKGNLGRSQQFGSTVAHIHRVSCACEVNEETTNNNAIILYRRTLSNDVLAVMAPFCNPCRKPSISRMLKHQNSYLNGIKMLLKTLYKGIKARNQNVDCCRPSYLKIVILYEIN